MRNALVHEMDGAFDLPSVLVFELLQVDLGDHLLLLFVFVELGGEVTLEVARSLLNFLQHGLADTVVVVMGFVFLLLEHYDVLALVFRIF